MAKKGKKGEQKSPLSSLYKGGRKKETRQTVLKYINGFTDNKALKKEMLSTANSLANKTTKDSLGILRDTYANNVKNRYAKLGKNNWYDRKNKTYHTWGNMKETFRKTLKKSQIKAIKDKDKSTHVQAVKKWNKLHDDKGLDFIINQYGS